VIHSRQDLKNAKRAYARAGFTYHGKKPGGVHVWSKQKDCDLAGAGEQRGDWRRLAVAAGIGAGVSALVAYGVKRKLEADFGSGAEEIRTELDARGSVLRREIETEAGAAGREAALGALRDWGVTPELIRDVGVLADAAADLVGLASSTGMTLDVMLRQVQARADAIRRGAATGFS
jgi:hypothetical protein